MRRKLVITIDTDETAENPGFVDLMNNLHDACLEQANELVAVDALEHGYYFSVYDPSKNNVKIDSYWDVDK